MKVCIIGGGPAGMFAAIASKESNNKNDVYIIEKNSRMGKKLLITGKGRCNVTNIADTDEMLENITHNKQFMYSSFSKFSNYDTMNFFEENGLKLKVERGGRVFPESDLSNDVYKAIKNKIDDLGIKVVYDSKCTKLIVKDNSIKGIQINGENIIDCDKCIIATGGNTYSLTGSNGDGYALAKSVGHSIVNVRGGLIPIKIKEKYIHELQGLSLKNISIQVVDNTNNKCIYSNFGEMLFTHFGVSGPLILSASSILSLYDGIDKKIQNGDIELRINLKPALTEEVLDKRVQREFEEKTNKDFKNVLDDLLPKKLIPIILGLLNIPLDKKVNQITKEERQKVIDILREFKCTISGFRPIDEGIITIGGINTKEIDPKTMQSKIIDGLYFAGEVIDIDAYTGGYNLQIAFSTGFVAGQWQKI